ncbi:MAG: polyamine aminopropyltransferase [bacterium]|nr:polyamine aminopropyltransferase [bacterium]
MNKDTWYKGADYFSQDFCISFKVNSTIHKEKSKYQTIEIVDTPAFGKMLLLDGFIMTTDKDEKAYHEMLVHPAMTVHPDPKKVLIIGGGDGGTVREVLKYPVNKITLVEIDEKVIETSKKFLPELSKGLNDPRVEVVIMDAAVYAKKAKEKYDIILVDSAGTRGPGVVLCEKEFLNNTVKNISPDIWVAQSESIFWGNDFRKTYTTTLKKLFNIVRTYLTYILSYGGAWTFTFASNTLDPLIPRREAKGKLWYYNTVVHHAAFQLPEHLSKTKSENFSYFK